MPTGYGLIDTERGDRELLVTEWADRATLRLLRLLVAALAALPAALVLPFCAHVLWDCAVASWGWGG